MQGRPWPPFLPCVRRIIASGFRAYGGLIPRGSKRGAQWIAPNVLTCLCRPSGQTHLTKNDHAAQCIAPYIVADKRFINVEDKMHE